MHSVGTFEVNHKMRRLVMDVLDSGRISYGPMSQEFEQRFARIHDCKYAVLSNSGTSSLQVALQALKELNGWNDGDEVIIPSVTFVATLNIILHNRMQPVLVDVDSSYYEIDLSLIEKAITPKTRAIIPVHLFGQPCGMVDLMWIANYHGLKVIEDSCECMFVDYDGRTVGSFGDVGCFSTYVAHLLTTGVGGIATTNDPQLASVMRSLVNHGRDGIYISIDDDNDLTKRQLKEMISRRFNFERIGHSFRITELESALALGQLDDWDMMIARRNHNAAYLTERLSHADPYARLQLPASRPEVTHSFMMYPIVCRDVNRDELVNHLESNGIETRGMLPLTNQPAYPWINQDDYPVAKWINENGMYIGIHQNLTDSDLDRTVGIFQEFLQHERVIA